MIYVISYIVMGLGVAFMLFGVIGLYKRDKDFYYRILVGCKVDTVGFLTLFIGLALRHGFTFFTGKIFLIVLIMMVLNPLVAHIVAGSAYYSGYVTTDEDEEAGVADVVRPEDELV